jgi:hypothetical protein
MTPRISATVSENRRRGRPRVFDAATFARLHAEMRRDNADISDRTVQNRLYQYTAQGLLEGQDWARWLIDPKGIMQGKRSAYRRARRGHKPQGTAAHLAARLMALVQDYCAHHASVDRDVLLGALQIVEDAVWEMTAP